jgi:hypothetical protein
MMNGNRIAFFLVGLSLLMIVLAIAIYAFGDPQVIR